MTMRISLALVRKASDLDEFRLRETLKHKVQTLTSAHLLRLCGWCLTHRRCRYESLRAHHVTSWKAYRAAQWRGC